MKRFSIIFVGLFISASVIAQEIAAAESELIIDKVTLSGFMDTYYSYNINNPGALGSWGTNGVGRIFDGQHNQIAFNMIQTKVAYESERLEIVGDLVFGRGVSWQISAIPARLLLSSRHTWLMGSMIS